MKRYQRHACKCPDCEGGVLGCHGYKVRKNGDLVYAMKCKCGAMYSKRNGVLTRNGVGRKRSGMWEKPVVLSAPAPEIEPGMARFIAGRCMSGGK